jgi:hypothetical protein
VFRRPRALMIPDYYFPGGNMTKRIMIFSSWPSLLKRNRYSKGPRVPVMSSYYLLGEATVLLEGTQQSEKPRAFNECRITTSLRGTRRKDHNRMLAGSYSFSPSLLVGKSPVQQRPMDGFDINDQKDHELRWMLVNQIQVRGRSQSTGKLYGRPLRKIQDFRGFTIMIYKMVVLNGTTQTPSLVGDT